MAESSRWAPHAGSAMLVRFAALAVPIAASVAVALGIVSLLPGADGTWSFILQALVVVVPATAVLWVVERLARRFLPLAALLQLSLAFPDRAPSRYAVARLTHSTRELQRRIDDAREKGIDNDPSEAAKMILALVAALSLHDRRTRGHSERTRLYTDLLAEELRLSDGERDRLRWAALVHDIGKLHVPSRILNKAGEPSEHEWAVLRNHPKEGERLCAALLPWLGEPGRAIVEHHERFDGEGYPEGLRGHEISRYGRVLSVADAFEVMTAARAYRRPMSAAVARAELTRCAGSQFDPAVVRAFIGISLGRLRLAMGPLSWLAQWPVLSRLPTLGKAATQVSGTMAGAAALSTSVWLAPTAAGEAPVPAAVDAPDLPGDRSLDSDPIPQRAPAADDVDVPPAGSRAAMSAAEGGPAEDGPSKPSTGDPRPGRPGAESSADPADGPSPDAGDPDDAEDGDEDPAGIGHAVDDLADGLTDTVDDVTDGLTDTVDDVTGGLTDTVDDVTDDLTDTVRDVAGELPAPLDEPIGDLADAVDDIADDLTDTADDVTDDLTDTVDDATDDLTDTIDDVVGGLFGRR